MRKLLYWISKIGNIIVVAVWFVVGLVVLVPISCLFFKKVSFAYNKVTGKTNLTWREFIEIVRANGLLGKIAGVFIKLGVYAIGDLVEEYDLMDEYIYIPV